MDMSRAGDGQKGIIMPLMLVLDQLKGLNWKEYVLKLQMQTLLSDSKATDFWTLSESPSLTI